MYLYLGGTTVVRERDVIGVFDLDKISISRDTRAFLADAQKGGRITAATDDLPKSFVVCCRAGDEAVYLSQMNTATLRRRSGGGVDVDKFR